MAKLLTIGSALALSVLLSASEHKLALENTNYLMQYGSALEPKSYWVDYDRLRFSDYYNSGNWFAAVIADVHNYYGEGFLGSADYAFSGMLESDTPFSIESEKKNYGNAEAYFRLYRAYAGYEDARHSVTVGLQKISFGVGRIWTPTDLFNSKNVVALEPDEIMPLLAARYSYAFSDLGSAMAVVSQRGDHTFKGAVRIKGYFNVADMAIDAVAAEDHMMIGYELEGDLFDNGALIRSEGGYFKDDTLDTAFFQGIVGIDYGFEMGLSVAAEWLYSSRTFDLFSRYQSPLSGTLKRSNHYFGASADYPYGLLSSVAAAAVWSADDGSLFFTPSYSYSLSDEQTLSLGAMLYAGSGESEFGSVKNSYYMKWKVTF